MRALLIRIGPVLSRDGDAVNLAVGLAASRSSAILYFLLALFGPSSGLTKLTTNGATPKISTTFRHREGQSGGRGQASSRGRPPSTPAAWSHRTYRRAPSRKSPRAPSRARRSHANAGAL